MKKKYGETDHKVTRTPAPGTPVEPIYQGRNSRLEVQKFAISPLIETHIEIGIQLIY